MPVWQDDMFTAPSQQGDSTMGDQDMLSNPSGSPPLGERIGQQEAHVDERSSKRLAAVVQDPWTGSLVKKAVEVESTTVSGSQPVTPNVVVKPELVGSSNSSGSRWSKPAAVPLATGQNRLLQILAEQKAKSEANLGTEQETKEAIETAVGGESPRDEVSPAI